MFGLRQKLAIGFAGLLVILLCVSGLSIGVLARYRGALDQFFYENWRSVEDGRHVIEAVERLDELARPLAEPEPSGVVVASANHQAAPEIAKADANCVAENQNITLQGEDKVAADLSAAWFGRTLPSNSQSIDGYRQAYLVLLDGKITGSNRLSAAEVVRRSSFEVRKHAQAVVDLNISNMRPIDGRAKEMADRAVLLMISGTLAGAVLAIIFTLVVARSILRPLTTITKSIREIEQGNLDLVVQVHSRDELRQLAEAFNSMTAKLREYRRTNRAKLIRTQQTTQLAINSLPDAVAVTGPDGTIELSNDAAQSLFGLIPGASLATAADKRLLDVYREVTQSEKPSRPRGYESAVEIYDAGGQLRFYLPHAVPICDGDNRPPGMTLVLADVTNLRKLDEVKSGLLSVVSHELKTPLTSIRMAVHLLLEENVGPLNSKQVELVAAAREDSDRLDKIIAGLLDMGRLESGRAELTLRAEKPERLVSDAVTPLRSTAHDKGVTIETHVSPDLPDVAVDPTRISHVLTNLLGNGLKFTHPGGRVTVSAETEGDDLIRFTVSDTGVGIPAEYLPRVFDRFFRVPGSNTHVEGAGLGLAIAREIVQVHGGEISVQSRVGEGTQFSFTLHQLAANSSVKELEAVS